MYHRNVRIRLEDFLKKDAEYHPKQKTILRHSSKVYRSFNIIDLLTTNMQQNRYKEDTNMFAVRHILHNLSQISKNSVETL